MRNLLLSLSLATLSLFAVACKSDADVDPREQYIGTYNVLATTTIAATSNATSLGILNSADGYVDILVQKGSATNELKLSLPSDLTLTATLDEGTFYMPPHWKSYEGDGAFTGNKLTLNYSLTANTNQVKAKQITTMRGKRK